MKLESLKDKTILITGGTGSFGKAFIKHILRSDVHKVIVFSRDELKQHEMQQSISDPADRLRYFLGDVRDVDRLYVAFRDVDIILHAAALKHINAGEYNPYEFVKTNVLGTENVLQASAKVGVKKVLCISSDKAAAPVTAYGATKALVEHLVRAGQSYNPDGTKFAALRYGNVAGSRGSVIPTWKSMIQQGAKILPVTDERMTRFFFRIEDAVDFSLWALEVMEGGELFVPKMPSFYVTDLAEALGCTYEVVGTRTTEKLAEEMVTREEARYFHEWENRYIRFRNGYKGAALPDGFEYASDKNKQWLTVPDLKKLVDTL